MPTPISLTIDLHEITATRGDQTFTTPTTLSFVQMPKSGWLFPVAAHLRPLLPGESPPEGTTPEQVSLFPAAADGQDGARHFAVTLNALILRFMEGQFFKVKPHYIVRLSPKADEYFRGHGRSIITAALAPISLGTTFE